MEIHSPFLSVLPTEDQLRDRVLLPEQTLCPQFLVPPPLHAHRIRGLWIWIQVLLPPLPVTLGKSFNLLESQFLLRTKWGPPIWLAVYFEDCWRK